MKNKKSSKISNISGTPSRRPFPFSVLFVKGLLAVSPYTTHGAQGNHPANFSAQRPS
jgi:hypothetical protein